ncbi:MAG: tetratricopeptide repeat protein [Acidobacteria bacterium]|nr:tetratricopeptide repeat protein [Acidobacteriota bacterium]
MDARPPTIAIFDPHGRRVEITRDAWRTEILPSQFRGHWNDADALAQIIGIALEDDFAADVVHAAHRLLSIDPDHARSAALLGAVLMQTGELADAARALESYLAHEGPSALVMTSLARVYGRLGDDLGATVMLLAAIEADPNEESALTLYTAGEQARGGDDAYLAALQRVAENEGSWRARLWLARHHLERHELEAAAALYQGVLVLAADASGVLTQISGDLGRHGRIDDIVDWVFPFYDCARHDAVAGLNFLQAFIERRDVRRGELLLHELMTLDLPPYRDRLMSYSNELDRLKVASSRIDVPDELSIELVRLDEPVWMRGLFGAQWLLQREMPAGRRIALLSLANTTAAMREKGVVAGPEDGLGRLTRAVPLYLADSLRFRSDAAPSVLLPIVRGHAMIVSGTAWNPELVAPYFEDHECVVGGELARDGESLALTLTAWLPKAWEPAFSATETGDEADFGDTLQRCETRLLEWLWWNELAIMAGESSPLYRPPAGVVRPYLEALGQAFALSLSASGHLPSRTLYGERDMLLWFLNLALGMPGAPIPRAMLLAGLSNSRLHGSSVYRELERDAMLLLDVDDAPLPVRRLTPLLYRLYDRVEAFERRRNELLMRADDDYVLWLASIESAYDR